MPTKKEVKELSKDLIHAIKWAAAEFNYIKELKEDLEEIKQEKDIKKEIKEISKAIRVLRYVGRAERRAAGFEEKVEGDLEDIYKDLSEHLEFDFSAKKAIMDLVRELDIEHNALVKYTSIYEGLLREELIEAEVEAQLLADIESEEPKKAEKIRASLMNLLNKIQTQVKDAEKWVSALEASLKKAEDVLKQLPEEGKDLEEGMAILKKYEFPIKKYPEEAEFMAAHPDDLREMAQAAGESAWHFFVFGLPAYIEVGIIKPEYWDGLVKMARAAGKNVGQLSRFGLPAYVEVGIIRPEQAIEFLTKVSKTNLFHYFKVKEVFDFFYFIERLLEIVIKEKISIIYAIDRSGRILGFLLHSVLSKLGLTRGLKCYYIHSTTTGEVTLYSEKQKEEIRGKNILLIDEYAHTGGTIKATVKFLKSFVGPEGKIIPCVFASGIRRFDSVSNAIPSWYGKKEYSGMQEKPHGGVEIDKGAIKIARKVRRSLSKSSKIIVEYLKYKGSV